LRISRYQSANGRIPFEEWLASLDVRYQVAVNRRIDALEEHDHFGDCRTLQDGLFEMRLLGPGLRIYFARSALELALLLGGSNKGKQKRAISLARVRLREFKERSA
jgi:putative addiction module killer protein